MEYSEVIFARAGASGCDGALIGIASSVVPRLASIELLRYLFAVRLLDETTALTATLLPLQLGIGVLGTENGGKHTCAGRW